MLWRERASVRQIVISQAVGSQAHNGRGQRNKGQSQQSDIQGNLYRPRACRTIPPPWWPQRPPSSCRRCSAASWGCPEPPPSPRALPHTRGSRHQLGRARTPGKGQEALGERQWRTRRGGGETEKAEYHETNWKTACACTCLPRYTLSQRAGMSQH